MIKTILYVGSKFEYENKKNGESLNKKAFFDSFNELGYKMYPVWYDEDKEELQKKILNYADKIKPDLIFFILQSDQIKKETLVDLKEKGFFLANFFGDDGWRFESFTKHWAKLFNVCITADKFSLKKYISIGQKNVILSQWAALVSNTSYKSINYKYDVSFIGSYNVFRAWFINKLKKNNINVVCFGSGWSNGRISYTKMANIILHSKINLNISNNIQYDIRYLVSNPKNLLNTLKSKKNISQLKARIFEVPTYGGFLLNEFVPAIDEYYLIGKEIICYKDIDEAILLIKYYLSNPMEREKIKNFGVLRSRKEHTYLHRIDEFMKHLNKIKYGLP